PYLSQIETGKNTKPSADILFKVSTALKVNVISLFYYAGYISQEQLASQLNVSLIESDIREDIRDSLYSLTKKENGFFLTYLKKDIINLISHEFKAPVSHMVDSNEILNPEDKIDFKKQLNKYLSHDIEECIDDSDIKDMFNKVYNALNMMSVIEPTITEFDNKKLI